MVHSYDDFEDTMTKAMQACGVTTQYYRIKLQKLDLDTDAKLQAAREDSARAKPDATLVMNEAEATELGGYAGSVYGPGNVTYTFQLSDVRISRVVWTAQVVVQVHGYPGVILANTAVEKMKADHVFDCPSAVAGHS
jgi:hypothetical protein